jgi:hypothetical protein
MNGQNDEGETADEASEVDLTPHGSTTYKILGKMDAPGGSGILGHNTATSGESYGVEGVADSAGPGTAGVRGEATLRSTSGATYGLEGVTQSSNGDSAAVRAYAPDGARGLSAVADRDDAVYAKSANGAGVRADAEEGSTTAVVAENLANSAVTYAGRGVDGRTNAIGVGAAGVHGRAESVSGETFGVHGVTQSPELGAAGVRAEAPNGGRGLYATATGGAAAYARSKEFFGGFVGTEDGSRIGLYAGNLANTNPSGSGIGVRGYTQTTGDGSIGVLGKAETSTGSTYGVKGTTQSTDQSAAGVYGRATEGSGVTYGLRGVTDSPEGYGVFTPDDANVGGDLDVGGTVRRNAMTEAHFGSGFTVSSGGQQVLQFDRTAVDEPGAWDTNNYEYTCPSAGHYQVTLNLKFISSFSAETVVAPNIRLNGSSSFKWIKEAFAGESWEYSLTQTLVGLSSGDTIQPTIRQESGSSKDMPYDTPGSVMQVRYLGDGNA